MPWYRRPLSPTLFSGKWIKKATAFDERLLSLKVINPLVQVNIIMHRDPIQEENGGRVPMPQVPKSKFIPHSPMLLLQATNACCR